MLSYTVKILSLLFRILPTECKYEYVMSDTDFDVAENDCNNRGLELFTISTYRQYLDVRDYFKNHPRDDSWLALERNTTTGNYQWLNGRVLTQLKWESREPEDHDGIDCGAVDVYSKQWYTVLCTDRRRYICISDSSYSVGGVSVDFYTAVINCQSEGRRLPVAITNLDTIRLEKIIGIASLSKDVWLGLIESGTQHGDYYQWVTGEHLTPPFSWANSARLARVHYFHDATKEWYSCDANTKRSYICQSAEIAVNRSPDMYTFVSNNALVMGSVRKTTNINRARKLHCALECLKDGGCIQFTIQGYLCRTYGESLVITDYNAGHVLWQRKIIS